MTRQEKRAMILPLFFLANITVIHSQKKKFAWKRIAVKCSTFQFEKVSMSVNRFCSSYNSLFVVRIELRSVVGHLRPPIFVRALRPSYEGNTFLLIVCF